MNLEDFKALSTEEQEAFLTTASKFEDNIKNLEAERDSFKNENDTLKTINSKNEEELKKTKELNFTLARKIDSEIPKRSSEDILHDMFMKGE